MSYWDKTDLLNNPPKDYLVEAKTAIVPDVHGVITLKCIDGTQHVLTLMEKLYFKVGLVSLEELDKKYNKDPCKG